MNAMNEFVKPTLVLAIICLVITALLSVSHEITQPIIDENERKTAEIARAEVLTEADSFEQIEGEFQKVYRKYIRLQMALAILLLLPPKVTPAIR